MKEMRKIIASPLFTAVCLLLAAGLLLFSGIGGARAALTYFSDNWQGEVNMKDIGVALLENGNSVSHRRYIGSGVADADNLSTDESENWDISDGLASDEDDVYDPLLARFGSDYSGEDKETFRLGQQYDEKLQVQNIGTIDQYVRVSIYKYWMNEDGSKDYDLDPAEIEMDYASYLGSDWIEDEDARTDEKIVLYYTKLLQCDENGNGNGQITAPFNGHFLVDSDVSLMASQTIEGSEVKDGKTWKTIKTVYNYDGKQFCIEARVDAVQDHHSEEAISSVWGRDVSITDGVLSLK